MMPNQLILWMKGILFSFLSAASLLFLLVNTTFWVRSYRSCDWCGFQWGGSLRNDGSRVVRSWQISSNSGMVEFSRGFTHWGRERFDPHDYRRLAPIQYQTRFLFVSDMSWQPVGVPPFSHLIRFDGWQHQRAGYSAIFIAHGILAVACAAIPCFWFVRRLRQRALSGIGKCASLRLRPPRYAGAVSGVRSRSDGCGSCPVETTRFSDAES